MRHPQNLTAAPTRRRSPHRKRWGIVGAFVVGTLAIGSATLAGGGDASTTDTQNLVDFSTGAPLAGESHLTRTADSVLVVVEAEGLVPGDAHTLWWVVFNEPGACSAPCGEDDIFLPTGELNVAGVMAAEIGIGNASGNIAKADGTIELGGHLAQGDSEVSNGHQILFPAGLAGDSILTAVPADAEVHVIVQSHGNARGGPKLLEQLSYVDANCTPDCLDLQAAIHTP